MICILLCTFSFVFFHRELSVIYYWCVTFQLRTLQKCMSFVDILWPWYSHAKTMTIFTYIFGWLIWLVYSIKILSSEWGAAAVLQMQQSPDVMSFQSLDSDSYSCSWWENIPRLEWTANVYTPWANCFGKHIRQVNIYIRYSIIIGSPSNGQTLLVATVLIFNFLGLTFTA